MNTTLHTAINIRSLRWVLSFVALAWLVAFCTPELRAQTYLQSAGVPTFSTLLPVENGWIDASNGRLHLAIPLGSYPQRAGRQLSIALVYDSNIWSHSTAWGPMDILTSDGSASSWSGWRLVTSGDSGNISYSTHPTGGWCDPAGDPYPKGQNYNNFLWLAPDGTTHSFPITTGYLGTCTGQIISSTPNGAAYATDATAYYMSVTSYTSAVVYANDGTIVSGPVEDTNGNYFSSTSDTLGRIPLTTTTNGSTITYKVLNAQGGQSTYTVTTTSVNVNSNFGQSGVTEYSGAVTVVQSIQLPDGTSYSFKYDCNSTLNAVCGSPAGQSAYYGLLTSMTLPTGATINYAWLVFGDAQGNRYTWIQQRSTPDGTWQYAPNVATSCGSGQVNCQQTLTVTKPIVPPATTADQTVYTFTLNGGGWQSTTQYYTGSSSLVSTVNKCWNFVAINSNGQCTYSVTTTSPATNVLKSAISTTMQMPSGTLTKTTEYSYDNYGNTTQASEWNYYATMPTNADRTTCISYLAGNYIGAHILNRPSTVLVVNNWSGTPCVSIPAADIVAQTNYLYDGGTIKSATGTKNHDDYNYGTGYTTRGNVTQIQRLVSGSTYLTQTMTYDMTGQVRSATDWNNNTTTYTYTDNFFNDNGNTSNPVSYSPPAPTNAYLTTVQPPLISASTFGYYFGTGQLAKATDPNGNTTYSHFYDGLNRPTATVLANQGWTDVVYPNASETLVDIGTGITGTALSTSCTPTAGDCRHDQTKLDGMGRPINQILVSDPDGQPNGTEVDTTYDSNGRVKTVSNPYRGSQNGVETPTYDGLDRVWKNTHADGNIAYTYYGAAVGSNGSLSTQACSGNGFGYPMLYLDEAGLKRQTWTDGFGRMIETDEPDATGSLSAHTCYTYDLNNNQTGVTAAGGTQTRSYAYDLLSRPTSKTEPETGTTYFYYTTSGGGLCSGDPAEVCRRTDARSITTTYSYDALNRLTQTSYNDSNPTTPTVTFVYDGSTPPSGCNPPTLAINNGSGRRTAMCDGSGATAWSYDTVGNIVTEKRTISGQTETVSYTYNLDSSIASITYPSGRTVQYAPGGAGRPLSAKDTVNSINYASQSSLAEYAPQGAVSSIVYGYVNSSVFTGITESRTYNNRLQIAGIQVTSATATALNLAFGYPSGNNGNINTLTDNVNSGQTQTYTYDPLNRLLTAQSQATSGSLCWGQSYGNNATPPTLATDALANLFNTTSTQCSSYQPRYTMNSNNSNQFTGTGISYDLAGNNTADGTYSYTFDAENRIISASGMSGGPYCYTYDGNGLRVAKSNGTSCTNATVDVLYWRNIAGNTIAESDSTGSTTDANYQEYVFFAGRRIARSNPASGIQYYYFVDQIGSTRSVAEVTPSNSPADGTVCFSETYYPYGQEQNGSYTAGCGQNYQFTGYERDAETGLDYAFARYYNDGLGRFMSGDPLAGDTSDPQTMNRYPYADNNPVNFIDPTGAGFWSWFSRWGSEYTPGSDSGPDPCWSGACYSHGGGGAHSIVLDWDACARGWRENGFPSYMAAFASCSGQPLPPQTQPPQQPQQPPNCRIIDPLAGGIEVTVKAGPEAQVGPFKAGLSWYKNLSTGQNGGEADLNVGIINVQADNATPPGGSFGGTTEGTQVKFSVLGFEKNLSTGEWSFKPSHTFKLGLQLGIGFEVSFNSNTFNQISDANAVCRARGGR